MRIEFELPRTVVYNHDGSKRLEFDSDEFDTKRIQSISNPFAEINAYWATFEISRQEAIFSLYEEIHDIIKSNTDVMTLTMLLTPLIAVLWDVHSLGDAKQWVVMSGMIHIPTNLKITYDPKDIEDQTYLRHEYIDLIALALLTRMMVPIWGEFMARTSAETGQLKEFSAFGLLTAAEILESEPMERLRVYLNYPIQDNKDNNQAATLAGLGSDDLPDWVLARVIISRMCVSELSANPTKGNIISTIHSYVKQILKDSPRQFDGKVLKKPLDRASQDSEDNNSILDQFLMKQRNSIGTLSSYLVYMEDTRRLALAIDPTLPMDKLMQCMEIMEKDQRDTMSVKRIYRNHQWLCQMIVDNVMPARSVEDSIERPVMLGAMVVTQAILWHWGFELLAGLATAIPIRSDNALLMSESRARIPTDVMKRLDELYPYTSAFGRTKNQTKGQNVGVRAATLITEELAGKGWQLNVPSELLRAIPWADQSARLMIPANCLEIVARFIIRVAEEQERYDERNGVSGAVGSELQKTRSTEVRLS